MRKNQRKIREARKSSHELFLEAKRRFQYKPNPRRSQSRASDVIQSPQCSSVIENNKQQHSNDFSWLDKMVNGFEWYSKELQENNMKIKTVANQPRSGYFAKRRTVLGEKSLNKINMSSSKPVIKRSLEKITYEQLQKKPHKAVIAHKSTNKTQPKKCEQKEIQDENTDEKCPKLFATNPELTQRDDKKEDLCDLMKNLSTEPLEVDATILNVDEPDRKRFMETNNMRENMESAIHPTPEKSPDKITEKKPEPCVLGKIKRNNIKHQQNQKTDEPKRRPSMSLSLVDMTDRRQFQSNQSTKSIQKHGNLVYFRETIHEQEQERSCQTSGRLEEKFREIFVELDTNKLSYIDRSNCCADSINDEIRYLIGPILSKIKYQEKKFTLQTFIQQGKRMISALETHQVSKLLRCSVTNRLFFLDTKRQGWDKNSNISASHKQSPHQTITKNYNRNGHAEAEDDTCSRRISVAQPHYKVVQENMLEHNIQDKIPGVSTNRFEDHVSSDISRDPGIRSSISKSLEKLRAQYNSTRNNKTVQRQKAISSQKQSGRSSFKDINRHIPLTKNYQNNCDRLDTSELHRSQEIFDPRRVARSQPTLPPPIRQNTQKHVLERQQFNRIDILNERLSKYIMENHLRTANRLDQFESISLEFAELRKHLRE